MSNHEIKYPREFIQDVRKYEDGEKATSNLWNVPTNTLLNNDMYLKEHIENAETALTEHLDSEDTHVTAKQKETWTRKAETTKVTSDADGLMSKEDKMKLDTVKSKAEENQNAFSNVKVGETVIASIGKTAQVEIESGDNISLTGDNATKKVKISVPNLGNLTALQTNTKNNLVNALNECFQFANNGKNSIASAIGSPATTSDTFPVLANEINEQKRLLSLTHGMGFQTDSIRTQASNINLYVHSHLPNMIVNNGGTLVNIAGAGVTADTSTLDTLYYSINNLAAAKNNQINAVTNERDNLRSYSNESLIHLKNMTCITDPLTANKVPVGILEANNRINNITGEKNQWYQNYVNMEADRNNWMNAANSKKSFLQFNVTLSLSNFSGGNPDGNGGLNFPSGNDSCDVTIYHDIQFEPSLTFMNIKLLGYSPMYHNVGVVIKNNSGYFSASEGSIVTIREHNRYKTVFSSKARYLGASSHQGWTLSESGANRTVLTFYAIS